MGKFTSQLDVRYIDGMKWRLTSPLRYVHNDTTWTVPRGFVTDFASVPRFFWRLLPPVGAGTHANYGLAAVLHDWLYATGKLPRKECDGLFYEAMRSLGVSRWRALAMYWSVRAFGWVPYNRYRHATHP